MSDRESKSSLVMGWSVRRTFSLFLLVVHVCVPAAIAFGAEPPAEPPFVPVVISQPVPAGDSIGAKPESSDNEQLQLDSPSWPVISKHQAPQESAALGSPSGGFEPRRDQQIDSEDAKAASPFSFETVNSDFLQVLGALVIVIGLLIVVRMVLVRASGSFAGARRPSGVVEVLARYPVARGQQLILLKLARRVLLVHQNGTAMTTLSEIVDENEVAALLGRVEAGSSSRDGAFRSVFSKFAKDHERAMNQSAPLADQAEIIDLTRRPGSLRTLFSGKAVAR